jgi:hypothetical protein
MQRTILSGRAVLTDVDTDRANKPDGTYDLIGINEGVIFFGFGASPIPEPASAGLLAIAGLTLLRRRR